MTRLHKDWLLIAVCLIVIVVSALVGWSAATP